MVVFLTISENLWNEAAARCANVETAGYGYTLKCSLSSAEKRHPDYPVLMRL